MRTSDSYQLLFRGLFERAGLLGIVTLLGLAAPSSMARAENHALLVGINDYQHVRDLRGSVNDILQIKRVLLGELGFDERNVQTLTNQEATKENILAALAQLAQQTRAGDGLLWYYSGHGFMILDQDGDEATLDPDDRYDEVLVPYDARPWPKERATDPNSTMLSDDEISQALSSFAGRRVVVVFDSCHSGSGTRDVDEAGSRSLYGGLAPEPLRQTRGLAGNERRSICPGRWSFYRRPRRCRQPRISENMKGRGTVPLQPACFVRYGSRVMAGIGR